MNKTVHEYLLSKHPVLKYIPLPLTLLDAQQLDLLQKQIHKPRSMSPVSRKTMKKIKEFAQQAKPKYKKDIKLYKFFASRVQCMQQIIISSSQVYSLQPFSHAEFPSLSQLTLSSNCIQDVSPLYCSRMPSLSYLDLSSNRIHMINGIQQMEWHKLKELHIGENRISSIEVLQMCQFYQLRVLDISSNCLTCVNSIGKMGSNIMVRQINLSSNYVADFVVSTHRMSLSQLNKMLIQGNPNASSTFLQKLSVSLAKVIVSGLPAGLSSSHLVRIRRNSKHGMAMEWRVAKCRKNIIQRRQLVLQ